MTASAQRLSASTEQTALVTCAMLVDVIVLNAFRHQRNKQASERVD